MAAVARATAGSNGVPLSELEGRHKADTKQQAAAKKKEKDSKLNLKEPSTILKSKKAKTQDISNLQNSEIPAPKGNTEITEAGDKVGKAGLQKMWSKELKKQHSRKEQTSMISSLKDKKTSPAFPSAQGNVQATDKTPANTPLLNLNQTAVVTKVDKHGLEQVMQNQAVPKHRSKQTTSKLQALELAPLQCSESPSADSVAWQSLADQARVPSVSPRKRVLEVKTSESRSKTSVWDHTKYALMGNKNTAGLYQQQNTCRGQNVLLDHSRDSKQFTKTNVWDHIRENFCSRNYDLVSRKGSAETSERVVPVLSQSLSKAAGSDLTARGLEWLPELHRGYQGIGFSMLPVKPSPWHVEDRPCLPEQDRGQERRLMEVRLGELPAWLGSRELQLTTGLAAMRRGWQRYYSKYIDVKKGGAGGVAMLLAAYCVLSYSWNYQHLSKFFDERQRNFSAS
ncbi:ATP synthase subunit f, mitochondrial [Acipenser ruthenus]|uniref:ATP synthase subunit f, mitochondrial n=1 Tax=Acipenser ruthenus TaxID=7906 RepID=A0A662Z1A4_ACIRT|nr:ATP synthase subunit f, mitochondrial [Acipenser ruthenus]